MMILESLINSKCIKDVDILDLKFFHEGFYIKIKTALIDDTILFIKEYIDVETRKYSYHWQTTDGKMLCRWDNSPHYSNISSFPYHKHVGNNVIATDEISLDDILKYLEKQLINK